MTIRIWAILLAAAPLAACGSSVPTQETTGPREIGVLTIEPRALATRLDAGEAIQLIDVRTRQEFAAGHLPGAVNIPLEEFDPATLPPAERQERILYCQSDRRSGIAAERLAQSQNTTVVHMAGGIAAWKQAGLPVTR